VAAYNVDIAIALKNSNKLMQLRKELKGATENQIRFNKAAKEANGIAVVTFNKLNRVLSRARLNLDKASLGTASFRRSAKALVNVEKEHNKQLIEREKLLNKLRIQADPNFIVREQRKLQIQENIRQLRTRKFGNVNPSRPADITFGQVGGKIGPAQLIDNRQGGFLAFSKAADEISKGVKANVKQTTKTASILSQQATRAAFTDMAFGVPGGQIGPATPLTRLEKAGFGKRGQTSGGPFAFPGGAMGRVKGGFGSALIGGGFPFLFGAGGLSAAMGGIAGGIGGALAPGGGFALSIAATAIASQIEDAIKFRKELNKVNAQLIAVGSSSSFSRKEIKDLAKQLNITKEEATKLVDTFVPRFNKPMSDLLIQQVGSVEQFDKLAGANNIRALTQEILESRDKIGQAGTDQLLNDLKTQKTLQVQLSLSKRIAEVRRKELQQTQKDRLKITTKNFKELINKDGNLQRFLQQLDPESELGQVFNQSKGFKANKDNIQFFSELQRALGFRTAGQNLEKIKTAFIEMLNEEDLAKFDKLNEKLLEAVEKSSEFNKNFLLFQEFKAPTQELEDMLNPMRQILNLSVSIRDGFEESFKGIIKGTMSVNDAFRNMLNRIADHFLDSAARMAATGLQTGFLSLFKGMFNFNLGPALNDIQSTPKLAANGGPAGMRKPFIVGERGPELFVPNQSGNIIPNHDLAGIGGGGTNIVVNVDASGSSVEGDEQGGRELGLVLSAAIESELIKQKRPGGLLA